MIDQTLLPQPRPKTKDFTGIIPDDVLSPSGNTQAVEAEHMFYSTDKDEENELSKEEAARIVKEYFASQMKQGVSTVEPIVEWAEKNFYIPETGRPIKLEPVQKCFLRFAYASKATTWVYSTIKKSGKTAISGLVGRYTAENSGNKAEIYFVANDKEQAKDRAHEAAKTSIELVPGYDKGKRVLPKHWKIVERQCMHLATGSIMRAIASDYEGAAGSNPTMTLWTELWGMTSERMKRLWDEMTPVPTRKRSIRYVETYAGFEDESELLLNVYEMSVKQARRITVEELEAVCGPGCWPYPDPPPFYINEAARTFAYWDVGINARRMPWQRGETADAYYTEQETTLRPEAFKRLHLNLWSSSVSEFIPLVWWKNCKHAAQVHYDRNVPIVMAVDASVSGDCTAVVGVSRWHAEADKEVILRFAQVWKPPLHGTINYAEVQDYIRQQCKDLNVVCCAYDLYQLHQMMQELTRDDVVWCKSFSQNADREIADKKLYDLIRDRKFHHYDEFDEEFMQNAKAYLAVESSKTAKNDRLRIVKGGSSKPVDPVVATSMATFTCLALNLT